MKGLGKNTRFKKTAPLSKNYRKGGATDMVIVKMVKEEFKLGSRSKYWGII